MRFIQRTGALLFIMLLLVGCGSNGNDQRAGPAAKGQIDGNAKELILGKWDEVPERPKENSFSRNEYTRDGKWRTWFLKHTPAGPRTLEGKEPGAPVFEGPYRFLDERTFTITTTNGDVTATSKYIIESLSKDKLVLVTEEQRKLVYTRVK